MAVIRTLKPGSRKFQKYWGDKHVAVRYRRSKRKLYTTIEIVVDEREQPHSDVSLNAVHSFKRRQFVARPIAFEENVLRAAAKRSGAKWSGLGNALPYCSYPEPTQQGS